MLRRAWSFWRTLVKYTERYSEEVPPICLDSEMSEQRGSVEAWASAM
jgi:hypothetical protein